MLVPKLVTTLRAYDRSRFARDLLAGVVVGVIALPLAVAFAIASGVSPERGLYTAIIGGFLISALGGSRVQIGGPTGAFVVIVYGVVQQHGVDGLLVATMMAGVFLIAFGVARLGAAIKFIPFPVTTGFTAGIALLIFSSQVKDFLGLDMGEVPAEFFAKWGAYAAALDGVNPWTAIVAGGSLLGLIVWPRISRRVPAPVIILLAATVVVRLLQLPVETIEDRFGTIAASLPRPQLPAVARADLPALLGPAFTIAMLCAIEALMSAVVADGMIGGRHRSNMELVAQGFANIAAPIFGGIPATGAIARTATNVKNGGRTPVAGIVHAVTLLLIVLFLGRWVGMIPLAALAAILVMVAYHMSEWRTFRNEFRAPLSDVAVMLTTFGLTVVVDLTIAIQVGMVLAAFLFMRRMAEVTNVSVVTREIPDRLEEDADGNAIYRREVPPGVEVYEINGPFFFGAADRFRDTLTQVSRNPKVLIIRMRNVPAVDSTGLRALTEVVLRSKKEGTLVLLADVHAQPIAAMARSGLLDEIGEERLFGNLDDALNVARTHLGLPTVPRPPSATPTVRRESGEYVTPSP